MVTELAKVVVVTVAVAVSLLHAAECPFSFATVELTVVVLSAVPFVTSGATVVVLSVVVVAVT